MVGPVLVTVGVALATVRDLAYLLYIFRILGRSHRLFILFVENSSFPLFDPMFFRYLGILLWDYRGFYRVSFFRVS